MNVKPALLGIYIYCVLASWIITLHLLAFRPKEVIALILCGVLGELCCICLRALR